ncbi:IS630 family transposase [Tunicatimonas pelagia]|uniref:IS630 family transposase n=1 Tax=Tunicatimonas pelagia TaxID=931531 RepID=UPI002665F297|nr:IS630 family transposase [Tunicatimonas pelagia]WKN40847.1 IS630 family transposase [Tunicatimonas pelagia]
MPTQLQISAAEMQELDSQRFSHNQVLVNRRLHCVYLKVKVKLSNELIGQCMGVHANQVGQYIRLYEQAGIAALCATNYGTNRSALEDHADRLVNDFIKHPPLSLAQARHRIIELTGIERDVSRIEAFLKRHGFMYRKCGYVPGKAEPEKQQQWLEKSFQAELEDAQKGEKVLLFVDAAHFVLSQFCCMMWCVRRLFLRSGAGRHRINVLGALNAITQQVTPLINTTYINAEVIQDFLLVLRKEYPLLPITIVLDNARYQHCKAVIAFAESLHIKLLFLPPYCPNLNIIERLWKFAKKKVLYGKYYERPDQFHQAVTNFFAQLSNHQEQLKSLLTLKFQTFDNSRIYAP